MLFIKRITVIVLLLITPNIFPADNATGPRVLVRSAPAYPVAGSTWVLTLLVACDDPNEVEVRAPHFTGSLFLDQVNKIPRLLNPATGQVLAGNAAAAENSDMPPEQMAAFERWTAMEYRFILNSPGTVSFDAFTVITPQGQTETDPFDINALQPAGSAEIRRYQLAWEGMPSSLAIGENAVFLLRINGSQTHFLPDANLFLPPVPPGYILEPLPLAFEERSAGIALKLRLIPLEANPFALEKWQVSHNGSVFEIPALRIAVTQAAGSRADNAPAEVPQGGVMPPFPSLERAASGQSGLYQKHHEDCETIYAAIKIVWADGNRALALAMLRQNERDHPAGAFFAVLRRGAEQALGFTGTNDEKRKWPPFWRKQFRGAVLRETPVRRIPDIAGEVIALFREGQPVRLPPQSVKNHKWVQVITNDAAENSGWVPEEYVIIY